MNGVINEFPGNYTQYREWKAIEDRRALEEQKSVAAERQSEKENTKTAEKTKLSFKERKEFELLEKEIEALESEKSVITQALSSGTLSSEELIDKSNRIGEVLSLIDEKTMRWLELSELA